MMSFEERELMCLNDSVNDLKARENSIRNITEVLNVLKMNLTMFGNDADNTSIDDRLIELSNKVTETSNLVEECYKRIEELSYVKLSNKSIYSNTSTYYVQPYDEFEIKEVPDENTYYSLINSVGLFGLIREEIIITENRLADIEDSLYWTED